MIITSFTLIAEWISHSAIVFVIPSDGFFKIFML